MRHSSSVRRLLKAGASIGVLCALTAPAMAQTTSSQTSDKAPTAQDTSTAQAVKEVVITARRKALQTAIEIKKNSDTIVDSVVADEAGKLPDNSITEVLQRVPGVSISRFVSANGGNTAFQIEGGDITVRGLPYNSSTLNGQQLFSANGASAISWNEVTPELMSGVDVYKAMRADLIEGGASLVDLRTHLPFDFKDDQFAVTVGGSYGTLSDRGSPRISALASKRFDTGAGEIGALWDFAYSRLYQQSSDLAVGAMFGGYAPTATRADHVALVPNGFTWSNSQDKRDRVGIYQALQWRPSAELTLTNTAFFSQYVDDGQSTSGSVGANPNSVAEVMPVLGAPVRYDAHGAFSKGTLMVGSTGNSVPGSNTTQVGWGWLPSYYQIDCGATYGHPSSSIQWDWSTPNYFVDAAPFLAQCGPPATLNPTGSASASQSRSSTLDISQSFVWKPGDRFAVRGGAQFVDSRMTGQSMNVAINQSSQLVNSIDVDLTGPIAKLSLAPAGVLDPSQAYLAYMGYRAPKNEGKMAAVHLDLEYRVSDDGFLRSISAGVRAAKRTENDNFNGTYWAPLGQSWESPVGSHTGDPNFGPGNIQYLTNPNVLASDYQITNYPNFFGGQVRSPSQMLVPSQSLMQSFNWYHLLQTYNGEIPNGTAADYWTKYIDQGLGKTDSRITNVAAYVEARFAHDRIGFVPPFSGNIGVRVFHDSLHATGLLSTPNSSNLALTEADSTAYFNAQQQKQMDPTSNPTYPTLYGFTPTYVPQIRSYDYTRALPSFNIAFKPSDKFIVRSAASMSSAPPNLNDIRAGGSISARSIPNPTNSQAPNILTGFTSNGNTGVNLKPTMIDSEDLTFEFYPSKQSFFYFDLFAKQIKDEPLFYSFIQNNLPVPGLAYANGQSTVGTPVSFDLPWLYLQNRNSPKKSYIKGFEIGGRQFFDHLPGFIPGWLNGFGIDANLTYIDSVNPAQQANSVLTPPPTFDPNHPCSTGLTAPNCTVPQTYPNLPYPGMSKWAYNITLLYNHGPVNFRLAYNWRDKALLSTNVNPLSYATSGGNPYTLNTSGTNFDSAHSWPVYNMVPAYMAAAGYLDLGFDYTVSKRLTVSFQANNLLNTASKTLQEPVPGVFEPYDYNVSDQRYELTARVHF